MREKLIKDQCSVRTYHKAEIDLLYQVGPTPMVCECIEECKNIETLALYVDIYILMTALKDRLDVNELTLLLDST